MAPNFPPSEPLLSLYGDIQCGFRTWILNDGIRSFKDAQSSRKWKGSGKGKQLVFIKTNAPQLLSDQAGAEWEESEESDGD
jgi:hypothetical protein